MSTTDLLNGPISGLPTYNVKNNPSIFHFNQVSKVNRLKELLLAISYNRVFIDVVTDLKNLGRDYYNKNPRKFCSTIQLSPVQGFQGQSITVYLPPPGGFIDNSIEYVKMDYVHKTILMRVLQNQRLPTCWSQNIKNGSECISASVNPELLSNNEKVLYYYIKNENFFNRVLQLLAESYRVHSEQRYQCYTLVFPPDLYSGTKEERTFVVTNDFLRAVYSQYLRFGRFNNPYKLPEPVSIDPTYNLPPAVPLTETELNKYMNNDTFSPPI